MIYNKAMLSSTLQKLQLQGIVEIVIKFIMQMVIGAYMYNYNLMQFQLSLYCPLDRKKHNNILIKLFYVSKPFLCI